MRSRFCLNLTPENCQNGLTGASIQHFVRPALRLVTANDAIGAPVAIRQRSMEFRSTRQAIVCESNRRCHATKLLIQLEGDRRNCRLLFDRRNAVIRQFFSELNRHPCGIQMRRKGRTPQPNKRRHRNPVQRCRWQSSFVANATGCRTSYQLQQSSLPHQKVRHSVLVASWRPAVGSWRYPSS